MSDSDDSEDFPSSGLPPYLPWKTFNTAVSAIKVATVPPVLDNTAKPPSMSGGDWRKFLAAAKFFDLVGETGSVTPEFVALVESHGTERWKDQVLGDLVPAYKSIIGDVPIDNGTAGQLDNAFKTRGGADNQILRKCVRFFLHVLTDAGITYSPRFSMRRESTTPRTRKKKEASKPAEAQDRSSEFAAPLIPDPPTPGMIRHALHFRRGDKMIQGALIVPMDANETDCAIVEAQLNVIRIYAGVIPK